MSLFVKQLILSALRGLKHQTRHCSTLFVPKSEYLSDDNFDFDYYCDPKNFDEVLRNIRLRRSDYLVKSLEQATDQSKWLRDNIKLLPNRLHEKWKDTDVRLAEQYDKDQFAVEECGAKPDFQFKTKKAEDIYSNFGLLMLGSKGLGTIGGTRSYLLMDDLADLKNALIDFTLDRLIKKYKFNYVTVPNLVYNETVNACGFNVVGDRNLVYKLRDARHREGKEQPAGDEGLSKTERFAKEHKSNQVCLSGTSEIPLAGLHFGEVLNLEDLPLRYCTVSRCYRKEISFLSKENGIYRVHYFDKIEMFGLTDKHRSEELLNEFIGIQKELFNELQLPIKILDMPPHELGKLCPFKTSQKDLINLSSISLFHQATRPPASTTSNAGYPDVTCTARYRLRPTVPITRADASTSSTSTWNRTTKRTSRLSMSLCTR